MILIDDDDDDSIALINASAISKSLIKVNTSYATSKELSEQLKFVPSHLEYHKSVIECMLIIQFF